MNKINCIYPFSERVRELTIKFDKASSDKNTTELENLLDFAESIIETEDAASQAVIYYSMGTVLGDFPNLYNLSLDESTKKVLFYYRKSIKLIEGVDFTDEKLLPYVLAFKSGLYTNYGNALDNCGRKVASIEQYKKALSIDPHFGMAHGNLGKAYQHYGQLEYDTLRRDYFHYFAYHHLQMGVIDCNPNTYETAKKNFELLISKYCDEYIEAVLKPDLQIPKKEYEDSDELYYRIWCLRNGLFLNTLNDLPITELYFANDDIQLPDMIVDIGAKPVFHGIFGQLKQEYIYARFMYFESLCVQSQPYYADRETYIIACPDFSQYSIKLEKMKTAFKTLYGLFDKIAYFLANYFDLGIKEKDINFRIIWQSSAGHGKNVYQFKNTLNPRSNFPLASLYWISNDFYFDNNNSTSNPELKRIKDIRDSLEHKYVKICDFVSDETSDGLALYVSEREMAQSTLTLLKILREAIINLALCINIAEIPHRKDAKDKLVVKMRLMDYEDDWKI